MREMLYNKDDRDGLVFTDGSALGNPEPNRSRDIGLLEWIPVSDGSSQ